MSDILSSSGWQVTAVAIAAMAFAQTSVVLLAALGAARILGSRGPAVRSAILRAALVAMVICPIVSAAFHYTRMPGLRVIPPVTTTPVSALYAAPVAPRNEIPAQRRVEGESFAQPGNSDTGFRNVIAQMPAPLPAAIVPPADREGTVSHVDQRSSQIAWMSRAFVGLWIAVSGLLLARLAVANSLITIVRRKALPAGLASQTKCQLVAEQLGVRAPVVLFTTGISGPCLVGWFRPAILLLESDEEIDREILVHELAHMKRQDCAWQLMARVATALVWFQPLMWIWSRESERAAEETCDDVVLTWDGDRTKYARKLAELAERAQHRWSAANAGVGVVGMRSSVGRRIARLLNATTLVSTQIGWRGRAGIALGALVFAVVLGAVRPQTRAIANGDEPKGANVVNAAHSGRVLDVDGKPVEGAEIYLVRWHAYAPDVLESTRTDANGNFAIHYNTPPTATKYAEIEVFASGKGVGYAKFDPAAAGDIQLKPSTQTTLTMLGPDGKPLAGLRVFPMTFVSAAPLRLTSGHGLMPLSMQIPTALRQRMAGITAPNGTVTLSDLPRGMKVAVGFDDDRFAFPDFTKRVSLSDNDATSAPATIQLEAGATIGGVVRYGPAGQPAAGIDITAQGTSRTFSINGGGATTDEQGQFKIKHLSAGEYNVMLALRDRMEEDWTAAAHEWVKANAGQNLTDINFTLIKGGLVTGKVIAADTGQPITETRVASHGPDHPRSSAMVQSVEADSKGTYTLRVPPGPQYVYVQGVLPPAYRQDRQDIREVKVDDGQTVTLDFKMPRREGEAVNGVVIGIDGKPAAKITVRAQSASGPANEFTFATTDAQGRFHFDSLSTPVPLSVRDGDLGTAESVYAEKGKGEIKLQLVRRVKLTLPGLITDEQEKPIAGARIKLSEWIVNHGMGFGGPIISGPDGRYRINDLYTDSDYRVGADADGYGEAQVKLALSENTRELPTLKLPRADATTGGVVIDSDAKPVVGVTVHLNNGVSPQTAVTDARGRFSFHIVPGTNHLIWIAVKEQGVVGPHANGAAGRNDLKLVLPKGEQ